MTAPSLAEAQQFLDENFAPWVLDLQPKVTGQSETGACLTIPITAQIARVGGIVSGQTLAALADTAMVIGACQALQELAPLATMTLDTQFVSPGKGDWIEAEAEVIKHGKTMVFARCTLRALPSGKTIAHATASLMRPPKA